MGSRIASLKNQNLINFLDVLKSKELLQDKVSKVVYADDQFCNQELLKLNFIDIGIIDRLVMFSDG